jgi:transcriptional regulator with GAF, ATPase, and Fis domain
MAAAQFLISSRQDGDCPETNGNRLHAVLSRLFPHAQVRLYESTDSNVVGPDFAGLILVQVPDPVQMRAHAQQLRENFPQARLLGILCNFDAYADAPRSLIDHLDDYLCCPFREADLRLRVTRLSGCALSPASRGASWQDFRTDSRFQGFLGDSPLFLEAIEKVPEIAACDCTCLIEGKTGTGKELFARAIHYLSPRKGRPFVPVNCGALPENLIENELFGHVKGAYTDAGPGGIGLLPFAEDGTLFLDEIDALSLSSQAKLLRVLQEHEYRPVGSPRMHTTKARILAATNCDLRTRVSNKQFREDLFHRLNILRLCLPQLSERSDDIPILAYYFLQLYARQRQKNIREISAGALHKLMSYHWPGNVRELESVIQRALLLSRGTRLEACDIDVQESSPAQREDDTTDDDLRKAKVRAIERFERSYLAQLMLNHQGNVSRAARAAGKERSSLQRLLRKYRISSEAYRTGANAQPVN